MLKYRHRKRQLKPVVKVVIVLGIIAIIWGIISSYLTSVLRQNATNKAVNLVNKALNSAVADELKESNLSYSDLVYTQGSGDNRVMSVQVNSIAVNQLKAALNLRIQDSLEETGNANYSVDWGTLLCSDLLSGIDTNLSFKISFLTVSSGDITSEFTAVGINQSKHSLYLDINCEVLAVLPSCNDVIDIPLRVCIAETVIIGEVPQVYLGN